MVARNSIFESIDQNLNELTSKLFVHLEHFLVSLHRSNFFESLCQPFVYKLCCRLMKSNGLLLSLIPRLKVLIFELLKDRTLFRLIRIKFVNKVPSHQSHLTETSLCDHLIPLLFLIVGKSRRILKPWNQAIVLCRHIQNRIKSMAARLFSRENIHKNQQPLKTFESPLKIIRFSVSSRFKRRKESFPRGGFDRGDNLIWNDKLVAVLCHIILFKKIYRVLYILASIQSIIRQQSLIIFAISSHALRNTS